MSRVFISGVSDGIGLALAKLYLHKGWTVYGISRRRPELLISHERFIFKSIDLQTLLTSEADFLNGQFRSLAETGVSIAYLNAGTSGGVPLPAREISLHQLKRTLDVNTLANKVLLDIFLALEMRPKTIVASSSIAGVRFRAGMLPYSMSKAALSAMCGVYAQEYPDVFFAVLGLCNVDTSLSRETVFGPRVPEFPEHVALQRRFLEPGYVVQPDERATHLYNLLHEVRPSRIKSGQYVDIRDMLQSLQSESESPSLPQLST